MADEVQDDGTILRTTDLLDGAIGVTELYSGDYSDFLGLSMTFYPGDDTTGEAVPIPESSPEDSAVASQSTQDSDPTDPDAPAGSRVFDIVVRDGLRAVGGDKRVYSTGKVSPRQIAGWQSPANAIESDDNYATILANAGEYCAELVASGFDLNIPPGATIVGIKVSIERSKV